MTSATRAPKLPVVAGCLRGLAALMYNFTKSVDEGMLFFYVKDRKTVTQFNIFLPLYRQQAAPLCLHSTSCMSVVKYLLDCFTDPQTAKEIFDFAMRAINPQVNLPRVNCSA